MENIAQYSVKEILLYSTTRAMWASCSNNRDVFAGKRAIYTDAYIAARVAEIDAAQALPNDVQRTAQHEAIRINLINQMGVCCDGFQLLKVYLRHAFNKEQFDTQYTECGGGMYEESTHNRISCQGMMQLAIQFVVNNKVVLMANQNMPANFEDELREITSSLNDLSAQYTASRQAAGEGAALKVEANNAIYNQCIAMGLDGQNFFKKSVLKSQFSFEAVSSMLSPSGASTAVFTIINADTNRPMIAEVSNEITGRVVTAAESDGRCEMGNLAAGETLFRISADGFTTQYATVNLKTGVTSRETVKLEVMVMDVEDGEMGGNVRVSVATPNSTSAHAVANS